MVGVGELSARYEPDEWAPDAADAVELVRELVPPGDAVLVKGSRSVGLEIVAEALGWWRVTRSSSPRSSRSSCRSSIGPRFIAFLRSNEFGQHISEDGPQHHFAKQGMPTMGGLLILFAATIGFLPVAHFRLQSLTVLFVTLACGAIGFLDDFIKLTHRRSLGLRGRWKMLLLAVVTVVVAIVARHLHLSTDVYIPVANVAVPLSYGWYPFLFLIIAGASNGTNLADGLDGLAAGTGIIALFTFMAMMVVSFVRSSPNPAHRNLTKLDLAIIGAALIGAMVGFLWYNAFPAEVIMGDTGSMALGGALARSRS